MKARYKLLIVVVLLWLGFSYEGAQNTNVDAPVVSYMTFEARLEAYESGLIDSPYEAVLVTEPPAPQGNLISRTGQNVSAGLQTLVREILRGIVIFFDGVIR